MKLSTSITVPLSPTEELGTNDDDLQYSRPQYQSFDSFEETKLKKDIIKPAYNIKHFYLPPPTSPLEDTITSLVSNSSPSSYFDINSPIIPPISDSYNTNLISHGLPNPASNASIKSRSDIYLEPQVLTVIQPEVIMKNEQVLVSTQLQKSESALATEIIEKNLLNENYIDWAVFSQILEMDEDAVVHEFSRNLLQNYFDQAHQTFKNMEEALAKANARRLADLALQLQGSSAALGFTSVTAVCEAIHVLSNKATDEASSIDEIRELYFQVRHSYSDTRFLLVEFFGRSFE